MADGTDMVLARESEQLFPAILAAKIESDEDLGIMASHLQLVTQWLDKVDAHHDPIIASATETLRLARQAKATMRLPGEQAKQYCSRTITDYRVDRQRKQDERDRLARLAQEEADAKAKAKEVKKLEKAGASEEEIDAVRDRQPAPAPRATPPPAAPKGLVTRDNWSAVPAVSSGDPDADEKKGLIAILRELGVSVTNLKSKGPWLLQFLSVNRSALNSHAKATTTQFAVPGWKAENNPTSHTRRG